MMLLRSSASNVNWSNSEGWWRWLPQTDKPLDEVTPLYIQKHRLRSAQAGVDGSYNGEAGDCGAGPVSQDD
jgi:hypothetical protein